ncbi:MAG: iron complex outermembrane receptor protein [Flavobacteriaceae bacterium]|jgi:iron complex outermembrane receptor protein
MKIVIVSMLWLALLLPATSQFVLEGQIANQKGDPLPGATIQLKSTKYNSVSDIDGKYKMSSIPAGDYLLKVSYVGFETLEKSLSINENQVLNLELKESVLQGDAVFVYATRASEESPTTFTSIDSKEIAERNNGQDIPFILQYTPSMVVTSDAGNGIGYTGVRIRGSDPTRINVTVNGVPINDSESHGVFWVNMPDFASSVDNIQIQRGVGTSTNGTAAFGASMNMQTDMPSIEPYAEVNNSFGSFNTRKHTVEINSGLINDRFAFQGRLSNIASDGFIDRASSDLQSYFLSGGYYGKKTVIKALTFGGKEVTYQSWWGTPQSRLENDEEGMNEVIANNGYSEEQTANLLSSGRTFNYYLYDNEVDNYQQDHYQLHVSHEVFEGLQLAASGHYTYGRGYYEQFREQDDLEDYNLNDFVIGEDTITSTDLIRRRWLDNHFYGFTFSANYESGKLKATLGGGWNRYDGDHFGEIIWSQFASNGSIRDRYYDNNGLKTDFNIFLKAQYQLSQKLSVFGDAQIRTIDYRARGVDNDQRDIDVASNFTFFNPKVGATYAFSKYDNIYASFAVGNREPVRGDFIDAEVGKTPSQETLHNLEIGFRKNASNYMFHANYYLMNYQNQLVLTGAVNDVGSSIRVNVPDSYRTGVELVGAYTLSDQLSLGGNVTLSRNKIASYTEILYDYGPAFDEYKVVETPYLETNISFSPEVIAGGQLTFSPLDVLSFTLYGKYVGEQYLDNTSSNDRKIDAYFFNDLKADFIISNDMFQELRLSLMINNLFNQLYSSNGYTFGYAGGDYVVRENYYYPQAGRNFMLSLGLKF